ncbi:hypothetical protein V1281_001905 [Nitrobacteraceae bacterium AZCC 2161]
MSVAEKSRTEFPSPRRMDSAPKRGWILARVRIEDSIVWTAARWIPEHGAFCAAPAGGIEHPLWPSAWLPQPTDSAPVD